MFRKLLKKFYLCFYKMIPSYFKINEIILIEDAGKFIRSGEYELALHNYNMALSKSSQTIWGRLYKWLLLKFMYHKWTAVKAWLLFKLKRYAESEQLFKIALESTNINPNWYAQYADLLILLDRSDAAIIKYTEALKININLPRIHVSLARILAFKGDAKQATQHFAKAVAIDSSHPDWQADLKELEDAHNYDKKYSKLKTKDWYDTVYELSDEYSKNYRESIYINVWNEIILTIHKLHTKSILDIGCGSGQLASAIKNETNIEKYVGIDFSAKAIEIAKNNVPSYEFIVADAFQSSFEKWCNHDLFIITEVLELMDADLALLEKIPAGKTIVSSVPNFDSASHVRYFNNVTEVKERYSRYFKKLVVREISIAPVSIIYLMIGEKN